MNKNKRLDVYYHGRPVGTLAEAPDKLVAFQYNDEWINDGFSISPFSLPLRNDVFIPNEAARERFSGLFGVFADSLPDIWGQLLLDRKLASLGIKKEDISTLDRLAYVGSSGMGALEYYPAKESDYNISSQGLDYDLIAAECAKVLSSHTSDQLDLLYNMGGSSGGTRPKILLNEGGKDWIVKFPSKNDPDICGKREYDYSRVAKECGIHLTTARLIKSAVCDGYFQTERFDRMAGEKLFSITFAGLLEADFRAPSCDYSTYMKLIGVLTKDNKADKEQMFKTMCFNVITHNLDDHSKNFSFLYTDRMGWRLAPAYDLTYSDTYWGEHTTSVNGHGNNITTEDLIKVGTDAKLSKASCLKMIEEITEKAKELEDYLTEE